MTLTPVSDPMLGEYVVERAGALDYMNWQTVHANAAALAAHLGKPSLAPAPTSQGTMECWLRFLELMRMAAPRWRPGDVWYDPRTNPGVRHALEAARVTRREIRVFYGDRNTGADALVIRDNSGYVSGAGIELPLPVLLPDRGVRFGPRLYELDVVKVYDIAAQVAVFTHPRYSTPPLSVCRGGDGYVVFAAGRPYLEAHTEGCANRWVAYLRGTRTTPPREGRLIAVE